MEQEKSDVISSLDRKSIVRFDLFKILSDVWSVVIILGFT